METFRETQAAPIVLRGVTGGCGDKIDVARCWSFVHCHRNGVMGRGGADGSGDVAGGVVGGGAVR